MNFLVYSVMAFALTWIIGDSKISLPFRMVIDPGEIKTPLDAARAWLLMLLECPGCLGFWLGIAALYFHVAPEFEWGFLGAIECGLFTAGACLLLARAAGTHR